MEIISDAFFNFDVSKAKHKTLNKTVKHLLKNLICCDLCFMIYCIMR